MVDVSKNNFIKIFLLNKVYFPNFANRYILNPVFTRILTPSRLYLIYMGNEGRARDSRPPPPHPPGNLFLTGKSDESR